MGSYALSEKVQPDIKQSALATWPQPQQYDAKAFVNLPEVSHLS